MVLQPTQAQAPAPALLGAGGTQAPGGVATNGRNPFWNVPGFAGGPMMGAGGLPGNFYPQMASFAAAQENAAAMVAVAKLGVSKAYPQTNSSLVVRGSVRKFNMAGALLSVAEWTRKTVEENLEWLVKLSKRHPGSDKVILLAYGDGCETLVLLDDHVNKMPENFTKIKKIGVGVTMANIESILEESKLAALGILQPSDCIWEHLRFETMASGDKKVDQCLFIHTSMTVWSDGVDGRRRVLQVATGSGLSYKPNALFEQQVLAKWKGHGPTLPMSVSAIAGASEQEEEENVTVITFNPKELLLLEKAFDNRMTSRDLKTNVHKFTDEDKKACQLVIHRAQKEFVMRGPPRKRKKKSEEESSEDQTKEDTGKGKDNTTHTVAKETKATPTKKLKAEEKAVVTTPPAKKSKEVESKSTSKTSKKTKKEEKDVDRKIKKEDDDDEPISKMVQKAETVPAAKKSRRSFTNDNKEPKPKRVVKTEPRGRSKAKKEEKAKESPSLRKRSKSRSKK